MYTEDGSYPKSVFKKVLCTKRWYTKIVFALEKPLIQILQYCNVVEEYSVGKCNSVQLTRVVLQSSVVKWKSVRSCFHMISAKYGGAQTPPPYPLSAPNQKSSYPPPLTEKIQE